MFSLVLGGEPNGLGRREGRLGQPAPEAGSWAGLVCGEVHGASLGQGFWGLLAAQACRVIIAIGLTGATSSRWVAYLPVSALRKKRMFAGRSASLLIRYGYHAEPNGT
jgi:hypothetical protein